MWSEYWRWYRALKSAQLQRVHAENLEDKNFWDYQINEALAMKSALLSEIDHSELSATKKLVKSL